MPTVALAAHLLQLSDHSRVKITTFQGSGSGGVVALRPIRNLEEGGSGKVRGYALEISE